MKKLNPALISLFIIAVFTACGKHTDKPDADTSTPLVKEISATSPDYHERYEYSYDDQKRLITTGSVSNSITYDTGSLQIVSTSEAHKKKVAYFSLADGRIKNAIYNVFINEEDQNMTSTAAFSYDTKGRLIKIEQKNLEHDLGSTILTLTYTYTWDDSDNLLKSTVVYKEKGMPESQSNTTYSGFSAENPNTLMAKNFGFDYFGIASDNGGFHPSGDGSTNGLLPLIHAGKTLPTKVTYDGKLTYNMVYHKNAQGNIDKIEETDAADDTDFTIYDITYQ